MPTLERRSKRQSRFNEARKLLKQLDELYEKLDDERFNGILVNDGDFGTVPELLEEAANLLEDGYSPEWDHFLAEVIDCAAVFSTTGQTKFDFLKTWADIVADSIGNDGDELDKQLKRRVEIIRQFADELQKTVPTEFS